MLTAQGWTSKLIHLFLKIYVTIVCTYNIIRIKLNEEKHITCEQEENTYMNQEEEVCLSFDVQFAIIIGQVTLKTSLTRFCVPRQAGKNASYMAKYYNCKQQGNHRGSQGYFQQTNPALMRWFEAADDFAV